VIRGASVLAGITVVVKVKLHLAEAGARELGEPIER